MNKVKNAYEKFTQFEEFIVGALLIAITFLVFLSALARFFGKPINWANDMATFFFAWEVFLGGDIVIRTTELTGVELIANRLPPKIQKSLKLLWFFLIVGFCGFLVFYGIKLSLSNTKRTFQALQFSYSFCTLCVPVGSLLMMISASIKIKEIITTPVSFWKQKSRMDAIKEEVER